VCFVTCREPRRSTKTYLLAQRAVVSTSVAVSVLEVASGEERCSRELKARRTKTMGGPFNEKAFMEWMASKLTGMADTLAKKLAKTLRTSLPKPESA
jgi:hypothetical protein